MNMKHMDERLEKQGESIIGKDGIYKSERYHVFIGGYHVANKNISHSGKADYGVRIIGTGWRGK
jgi:hypothetical protein